VLAEHGGPHSKAPVARVSGIAFTAVSDTVFDDVVRHGARRRE